MNPAAGGGKAARVAPSVERALREHGVSVRRVDSSDMRHARELAAAAARGGESVLVLSGDGMVGALADELRGIPGAVLGVLPGGRGNDFARVLGIPEDPVAACATLADASARPVDLGVVSRPGSPPRAFIGIASVGFDSDANRIANEAPAWLGGQVYAYGALRALVSWRPARFEIELHTTGERHSFTGYTVAAANSRAYGGGMHMAPDALLDDGELELIAVEQVGKASFVANLPKVFAGTHVELPSVRALRSAEVTISADRPFTAYADGDPIGELPVRVSALPGAINVIVPRQATDGPFAHPSPLSASPLATHEPGASPAAD